MEEALQRASIEQLRDNVLPHILDLIGHPRFEIMDSVESFLTMLAMGARQTPMHDKACAHEMALQAGEIVLAHASRLCVYPTWFCHSLSIEDLDNRHLNFVEFRKSIANLVKHVCALDMEVCIKAFEKSLARLTVASGWRHCSTDLSAHTVCLTSWEIESELFLLQLLARSLQNKVGTSSEGGGVPLEVVQRLLTLDALLEHNHWAVQLAFMDIFIVFNSYFCADTVAALWKALEALWGKFGLRSEDVRVRRRATFVLLQLVERHVALLAPKALRIYVAIRETLDTKDAGFHMPPQETFYLYQVVHPGVSPQHDRCRVPMLLEAAAYLLSPVRPRPLPLPATSLGHCASASSGHCKIWSVLQELISTLQALPDHVVTGARCFSIQQAICILQRHASLAGLASDDAA